jgi:hypothetical protein
MARKATVVEPKGLSPFEGKDVAQAKIIVTNTGDGLSQNLKIEPVEYHHGERRILIMEADVLKVRFDRHATKDDDEDAEDALERVHIFRVGTAIVADEGVEAAVRAALDAQKERIRKAKEEAEGTQRLAFPENDPAADLDVDDKAWEAGAS